jgi:inorganic pyrophosphatase
MTKIEETVNKYLGEMKSMSGLPDDVQKGIKHWVDDYKTMRAAGNVKGAKDGKRIIDKEIKRYGLNPKEVYGDM